MFCCRRQCNWNLLCSAVGDPLLILCLKPAFDFTHICTYINSVEEYNRLKELVGGTAASNVHCVAGEYDLQSDTTNPNEALSGAMPSFPETKVIQLGSFRVGIIGVHQVAPYGDLRALSMVRKRLGVDVLVCGWRRKNGVVEYDGGYYIFPVSSMWGNGFVCKLKAQYLCYP